MRGKLAAQAHLHPARKLERVTARRPRTLAGFTRKRRCTRLPCVCANLHRTERTIDLLYGAELRKAGLRTNQLTLMEVLKFRPGATQASLSAALNLCGLECRDV